MPGPLFTNHWTWAPDTGLPNSSNTHCTTWTDELDGAEVELLPEVQDASAAASVANAMRSMSGFWLPTVLVPVAVTVSPVHGVAEGVEPRPFPLESQQNVIEYEPATGNEMLASACWDQKVRVWQAPRRD